MFIMRRWLLLQHFRKVSQYLLEVLDVHEDWQ